MLIWVKTYRFNCRDRPLCLSCPQPKTAIEKKLRSVGKEQPNNVKGETEKKEKEQIKQVNQISTKRKEFG